MPQADLERYLTRTRRKWRIIKFVIAVLAAALAIGFLHLWEQSAKIVYHEPLPYQTGSDGWESVEYNAAYPFFFVICVVISALSVFYLIYDLISCRFRTVIKGDQYLTVYRGNLFIIVYVDGAEKGRSILLRRYMLVEVWLANRTRATVHFTASPSNLAHISFSDHTATIEV